MSSLKEKFENIKSLSAEEIKTMQEIKKNPGEVLKGMSSEDKLSLLKAISEEVDAYVKRNGTKSPDETKRIQNLFNSIKSYLQGEGGVGVQKDQSVGGAVEKSSGTDNIHAVSKKTISEGKHSLLGLMDAYKDMAQKKPSIKEEFDNIRLILENPTDSNIKKFQQKLALKFPEIKIDGKFGNDSFNIALYYISGLGNGSNVASLPSESKGVEAKKTSAIDFDISSSEGKHGFKAEKKVSKEGKDHTFYLKAEKDGTVTVTIDDMWVRNNTVIKGVPNNKNSIQQVLDYYTNKLPGNKMGEDFKYSDFKNISPEGENPADRVKVGPPLKITPSPTISQNSKDPANYKQGGTLTVPKTGGPTVEKSPVSAEVKSDQLKTEISLLINTYLTVTPTKDQIKEVYQKLIDLQGSLSKDGKVSEFTTPSISIPKSFLLTGGVNNVVNKNGAAWKGLKNAEKSGEIRDIGSNILISYNYTARLLQDKINQKS